MQQRTFMIVMVLFTIMISACAKPKAELSVSKMQIHQGETVSVNWKTTNAKEVILNGQPVSKIGTQVFQPDQTIAYELVGKRGNKEAKDSKTVIVEVIATAPTVNITAERTAIIKGNKTRIRWSSQHADKVEITGLGSLGPMGEREIVPAESTTYTATAKGPGGKVTDSVRVTVIEDRASTTTPSASSTEEAKKRFERFMKAIFFDFDKADLRADAKTVLEKNAQFLLQSENNTIGFRIEGNCDPQGSEEYNLALGDRRGNTAKTFLISQGIDPARIDVTSNGKRFAAGTSEGMPSQSPSWAHDRRDDFTYLRGGEQLRP